MSEVVTMAVELPREKEELLPLIERFGTYTKAIEEQRRRAEGRP